MLIPRNNVFRFIKITALSALLSACMSAAFTGAGLAYDHENVKSKVNDQYLQMQAQDWIKQKNSHLKSARIRVDVFQQQLLIVGQVQNAEQKKYISQLFSQMENIDAVYNQLKIKPVTSLAQHNDDLWLSTKIHAKLLTVNGIDLSRLSIIVEDGHVYLRGDVTAEQARISKWVIQHTDGVKGLISLIRLITLTPQH